MNPDGALLLATVHDQSGADGVDEALLRNLLDFCYRSRRRKPACLDLLVAGDVEMTRMNRRHLRRDETTDVLAFEDGEEEDGRVRLGDVAINAELAARVAEERGETFADELAFYALHGLLHLLGMDDETDEDRAAMLKIQARTMRDFGLAPGADLDAM